MASKCLPRFARKLQSGVFALAGNGRSQSIQCCGFARLARCVNNKIEFIINVFSNFAKPSQRIQHVMIFGPTGPGDIKKLGHTIFPKVVRQRIRLGASLAHAVGNRRESVLSSMIDKFFLIG
jgi:hypothetical protein